MVGAGWLDWWKGASQKKCSATLPARSSLRVKTSNLSAHPRRTSDVARKSRPRPRLPNASGRTVVTLSKTQLRIGALAVSGFRATVRLLLPKSGGEDNSMAAA
jgi:hypothetical protein